MLEGSVDFLDKPVAVFVRLKHAVSFNDVPEVDIPTRFLFFYVSPKPSESAHIKEDSTGVGMSLGGAEHLGMLGSRVASHWSHRQFRANEI